MAYNNPFFYNRDSSVGSKYSYIKDLSEFKPVYGSSVSFTSRVNYVQTVDNSLKVLPSSENSLSVKYSLKFLLSDNDAGNLLKSVELGGGYRHLKFYDPSNLYLDLLGLAEDYSINKTSPNLNEVNVEVSSYFKSPIFNWRTSSFLSGVTSAGTTFDQSRAYSKYDFVYYDVVQTSVNKIDNFWFAKNDIAANTPFSTDNWTKNFFFDTKLPFDLRNQLDVHQSEYRNSFIQNIKHKDNSNVLKTYSVRFEAISDAQCRAMLFFLEKRAGYRRFIYEFPIFLKSHKVFIATQWTHSFKHNNCHDLNIIFVEEPNPNVLIDGLGNYYLVN